MDLLTVKERRFIRDLSPEPKKRGLHVSRSASQLEGVSELQPPLPRGRSPHQQTIPIGVVGPNDHVSAHRAKSCEEAVGSELRSKSPSMLEGLLHRLSKPNISDKHMDGGVTRRGSLPPRKKSDPGRLAAAKAFKKPSRSPNLPKKQASPESSLVATVPSASASSTATPTTAARTRSGSGNMAVAGNEDAPSCSTHSNEDQDLADAIDSENGTGPDVVVDDVDAPIGAAEGNAAESQRTRNAIDHLAMKISKTKEQIKTEQSLKESNVNEYLKLAAGATDRQQAVRIKAVFEKRNQKSAQCISQLQKKLENYQRKLTEVETHGVTGHKQAKEVLRDVHQGLKGVKANIKDGFTGISGGVVDNIKGAKDTIVSKPKEFAHLLKNKFGSADNITQLKMEQETLEESEPRPQGGGTLPASFRYGSDDDNSSLTSGSGFGGAHSSPQSQSQNTSQTLPMLTHAALEPLLQELQELRETTRSYREQLQNLTEEFDSYKASTQSELMVLGKMMEEENSRIERMEEQMNDLTELHQNEITNFKQDIASMEEKIEYRFDERTTDLSDLVDNCQTRIQRLEQQQQQQQILSMEMVENVTFRTILSKLINVLLALLAVILVFVSTAANFLSPFIHSRMRTLSTLILIFSIVLAWQNWDGINAVFSYVFGSSASPGKNS